MLHVFRFIVTGIGILTPLGQVVAQNLPNVVIIFINDMGYDDIGPSGRIDDIEVMSLSELMVGK